MLLCSPHCTPPPGTRRVEAAIASPSCPPPFCSRAPGAMRPGTSPCPYCLRTCCVRMHARVPCPRRPRAKAGCPMLTLHGARPWPEGLDEAERHRPSSHGLARRTGHTAAAIFRPQVRPPVCIPAQIWYKFQALLVFTI